MPNGVIKFAEFELDGGRYELRRGTSVLKLEKIPMELLTLLVESNGRLVTREQIIDKIWGKDVFLDTEHGINTAIRKIRSALGDDPEQPRFVQTVTGKGYRFIAPLTVVRDPHSNGKGLDSSVPVATDLRAEPRPIPPSAAAPDPLASATTSRGTLPRHSTLFRMASLAILAVIVVAAALFGLNIRGWRDRLMPRPVTAHIRSLAVLPLENLSGDSAQEYFADGMTDELITMLAKNSGLRVISRTSVMQYKKVHRPLPDIARELGVDGILEGSVERSANRVHLNAQLIYAPSDMHIWAESYDRDISDIGALQSDLARTIARQVGLTTSAAPQPERRINPEAHDAYLLGRYYWFAHHYEKSREYIEKAVQLQPDYAAAHAALADSYLAPVVLGAPPAEMKEAIAKTESATRKALALDDSLAETHHSMAAFHFFIEWNWEAAERESARAVELNPRLSEPHHLRAYILLALQRTDEAIAEDRQSMEIDPRIRPWVLGYCFLRTRQFDAGIGELRARVEVQPDDEITHEMLSDLYWQKGMYAESVHELAIDFVPKSAAELESAFRRGGAQGAMEWRLAHRKKLQAKFDMSPLQFAETTARLGRKQETLHYLEQAYADHVPWLAFIQNEPDFDFLHSEPRYQAIVKKMGLPPAR